MASFQTSQYVEELTVKNIYPRGSNNTNIPAFRLLASDGQGGTLWTPLSSLAYGGAFHTIKTTSATYNADAINATFTTTSETLP